MIQPKRNDGTHRANLLPGDGIPGLVSVIVPIYNRETLIDGMLESVKSQTYRPIEIIAVDDGSTDRSAAVVREWAASNEDQNLVVRILKQENSGAPAARNRGLSQADGEFIQFFDSDDRMLTAKLQTQVSALRDWPAAGFAYSNVRAASVVDIPRLLKDPAARQESVIGYQPVAGSSIPGLVARGVFRRSTVRSVGYWSEALRRYQDWEYSVRYVASGQLALACDELGFFTGLHDNPRIKDANDEVSNTFGLVRHAAESALNTLSHCDPEIRTAKIKIAQLYSFALVVALRRNDVGEAKSFVNKIRELTPPNHTVRMKNEAYYQLASRFGAANVDAIAKRVLRWKKRRSGA
ncbi:glycosyltransferase family 2 protein [Salinisphaera japonica]|uniref:glycosyltransferase family 2 protein n=1 Tax=Salinisphaera japonica TaxID=1304270 RepID=UPI000F4C311A|nr:glycosyltransferase family A protein [Salinisphaera japonica]